LFERALALDPRAVEAQIWLALMLTNRVIDFVSGYFHYDAADVDLQRADELIARALAASPNSAWAHYVKGQVLRAQSRFEDAAIEYETAIALDRNLANAYAWLGRRKLLIGSPDEVIPPTEYAIRLSPRDRNLASWCAQIAAVHLLKARTDEAVRWFEKARSAHAGIHHIHASLAAGYVLKGEMERAAVALAEARRLSDRYSSIARLKAVPGTQWFAPKVRSLGRGHLFRWPSAGRDAGRMTATRRLAAILAADVAGYSRLMGADEEATHERLKAHRRELADPKIHEHSGRIVKTTGDGLLVEFPSVVDAVRCAAELQRGMIDREASIPESRRIRFRIGINLGDVIVEDGDIFGDGVNVAARLEALAEPRGICISRMVRDQIRDKLAYAFDDLGEQSVKNIARPVRVYALRPEAVAALPASSAPSAPPISQPVFVPHLSIVVLPFANLGNDPEQQYFADGITEDLTTNLSRIAGMLVISRTYQGKRVDTKQVGRELGVRYVLEGSVRRSDNQIRINVQLIDAETDAHLWAERFNGDTADLFTLQDEVTSRIAIALNTELVGAEAARLTVHPDTLDYIFRGRATRAKPPSRESYGEAIDLYERALALDPQSVEAQSWLAIALTGRVIDGVTDTAEADIARAEGLAAQALAGTPRSGHVHYAKGQVLRAQRRFAEAIPAYETVLAFDPNWVMALFCVGQCKLFAGSIEETIPLTERALRLSPREPHGGNFYVQIGMVHLLQSRTEEAVIWLERARNAAPARPQIRALLAAAYALGGDTDRATAEFAEARKLSGDHRYSSVASLRAVGNWGCRKSAHCLKTPFSPASGWPGCRKNDRDKVKPENRESRHEVRTKRLTPYPGSSLRNTANLTFRDRRDPGRCRNMREPLRFGAAGHHDHRRPAGRGGHLHRTRWRGFYQSAGVLPGRGHIDADLRLEHQDRSLDAVFRLEREIPGNR
jgi:class 3 adenylate cyclase/TolB-like protein/Flp pilus assembly protein TadD